MQHKKIFHINRRFGVGALLLVLWSLSGCGPLLTAYADRSKFDAINDTTQPDGLQDAFMLEMADRFGLMAWFAEIVYRRDFSDVLKDHAGCGYLVAAQAADSKPDFGMPYGSDGRWTRWLPATTSGAVTPCLGASGLYFETYIYTQTTGRTTEAVIAFRGTENRSGQYLSDWGSNIAASLGLEPKQYQLAAQHIPLIVQGLKKEFNSQDHKIQIYATGHSLGGGLAQQAGYLSRDIQAVFTFNTSPVTNWSKLRIRGAVQNNYPIIYRIYHGGEILEKVRFVSTSFTQARYNRHDIGLQFVDEQRASFKGHSMQIIACNFAKLIAQRKPAQDAAHHYPVLFIDQQVLAKGPKSLC
jgi:hypothetical protein